MACPVVPRAVTPRAVVPRGVVPVADVAAMVAPSPRLRQTARAMSHRLVSFDSKKKLLRPRRKARALGL